MEANDDVVRIVDTIEKLRECIKETKSKLAEEELLESYWCNQLRKNAAESK